MKKMIFILIFVALFFAFAQKVKADELLLGQHTWHAARFYPKECHQEGKYICDFKINDDHPLIGINTHGYTIFAMENSYDKTSIAVLKTFKYDLSSNFRAYVSAGIVSGYEDKFDIAWHGIMPALYPGIDIHPASDKWGVMITAVPNYFVGIGVRFKIGDAY